MKMFKTMIVILSALTIIGVAALIIILNVNGSEKASGERSIDEIREASLETTEITTDLESGDYIRIRFRIVTDSKASLEELEKRDFQMKNILIKELAAMDTETFQSGLDGLEQTVKQKLNDVMQQGTITDVYTIEKVLQ
ncbi:flagellar basal body-associated protein FliL [Halobacillus fulvus]|nr:flagellar basal body-associated protein FliL [Halobacillus fulvus]